MPEKGSRRAVNFDLVGELLEKHYPKSNTKQAYYDIENFMTNHGFEHRQGSGYCSTEELTRLEFMLIFRKMIEQMPWLAYCVRRFDITNIGKTYDLIPIMELIIEQREQKTLYTSVTSSINHESAVSKISNAAKTDKFYYSRITHEQLKKLIDSGLSFDMKGTPDNCMIRYSDKHKEKIEKILSSVKKQNRQTKR